MSATLPPMISVAEAAIMLHKTDRAALRWLKARAGREPMLLVREEGEKSYSVSREALRRVADATQDDVRETVARIGEEVREVRREVRGLTVRVVKLEVRAA